MAKTPVQRRPPCLTRKWGTDGENDNYLSSNLVTALTGLNVYDFPHDYAGEWKVTVKM